MRLKEYEIVILVGCACAGFVWAILGMIVLIERPETGVNAPTIGDITLLILFFPATLGLLVLTGLVGIGLMALDPFTVPALVGILLGLIAGLVIVLRTRD